MQTIVQLKKKRKNIFIYKKEKIWKIQVPLYWYQYRGTNREYK